MSNEATPRLSESDVHDIKYSLLQAAAITPLVPHYPPQSLAAALVEAFAILDAATAAGTTNATEATP